MRVRCRQGFSWWGGIEPKQRASVFRCCRSVQTTWRPASDLGGLSISMGNWLLNVLKLFHWFHFCWNYMKLQQEDRCHVMWLKLWNIVFAKHKTQGITPFNSQVKRRVSELRRNVACVRREALEGAAYCNRKSNNHDQAPVPKAEEGLCWSTRINPRASSFPSSIWPGTKVLICGSFFRLRHNWPGSQMVRKCGKPWKHLPGSAALPAVLEGGAQRCACCSICVHNLFNKLSISTVVITSIY